MLSGLVNWSERNKLSFESYDLFDRVINLRFKAGREKEDVYIVRSDYEIRSNDYMEDVIAGKNTGTAKYKGTFQRCRIKPSIKVQMRQVSSNTAIEIDIFINNFYMLSKDGKVLMSFNHKSYPLNSVDIQMGYFGQFEQYYGMNADGLPTKEQFFSLDAPADVKAITCHVQYVQTDNIPPNYTLHIHGYVGSCYNKSVYSMNEKAFAESLDKVPLVFEETDDNAFKFTNLAHYLFNNVTSRFFRRSEEGMSASEVARIKQQREGKEIFSLDQPSAKSYGVRVFMSECLVASELFTGKYVYKDDDGNIQSNAFFSYGIEGDNPMQALNRFIAVTSNTVRVLPLNNGDYAMYLKDEFESPEYMKERKWFVYDNTAKKKTYSLENLKKGKTDVTLERMKELSWSDIQTYIRECLSVKGKGINISDDSMLQKIRNMNKGEAFITDIIPCVYNINADALTTIVCPFFFYLNTFDTLRFNTRYALGGLVDYYIDNSGEDTRFTVLWIDYSFATVEDVNECNIVSVSKE